MPAPTHLTLLASAWILYAAIHSILASNACKSWFQMHFPEGFRAYRLTFNLGSILLLIPPLWLLFTYPGEPLWQWPVVVGWIMNVAALAAVAGFFTTLSSYDMAEFIGTRQLADRNDSINDQAPMGLSWAHRFVRHPWYFFGLIIIWTREMDAALLLSAVILTLYLIVGSRLEEKKLVLLYGDTYRRYMQRVPGLIPLPWRYLRRSQVQEILAREEPRSPR